MLRSPLQSYTQARKTSITPREAEAEALFSTARLLEEVQRGWELPGRTTRLGEALRRNQRLWTVFQGELLRPDHELPAEIRRNLIQLSLFVDRRTFEVLRAPNPAKLTALIDINRQIASGLTATP